MDDGRAGRMRPTFQTLLPIAPRVRLRRETQRVPRELHLIRSMLATGQQRALARCRLIPRLKAAMAIHMRRIPRSLQRQWALVTLPHSASQPPLPSSADSTTVTANASRAASNHSAEQGRVSLEPASRPGVWRPRQYRHRTLPTSRALSLPHRQI